MGAPIEKKTATKKTKVKGRKRVKCPVKDALTGYTIFSSRFTKKAREENEALLATLKTDEEKDAKKVKQTVHMSAAGKAWQAMNEDDRAEFAALALKDRDRYLNELQAFIKDQPDHELIEVVKLKLSKELARRAKLKNDE